jgi:site-specific DNA-methyltransferase (adenine-specific)
MPKPYYQDKSVTIYHGDCRDILPALSKVGAVFIDPPYNVALGSTNRHSQRQTGYASSDDDMTPKEYRAFLIQVFAGTKALAPVQIVTPGNTNQLIWPRPLWTIAWTKPNGCSRTKMTRGKRISLACWEPILIYGKLDIPPTHDVVRVPVSRQPDAEGHPCPKPLKLMTQLIAFMDGGCIWLDPFMGSGTTILAAKIQGGRAVGIELEERYCEIAANRLAQETLF